MVLILSTQKKMKCFSEYIYAYYLEIKLAEVYDDIWNFGRLPSWFDSWTQKAFLLAIVELSTHCLPFHKLVRHSVSVTIKLCLQVFKINT